MTNRLGTPGQPHTLNLASRMMIDIFAFWSLMQRGDAVHPDDQRVFARMNPERHGFKLDCLPACFGGRLKTAPVVFLYLSPGYSKADVADANSDEGKDYYFRRWGGDEPFRDETHGRVWLESRTRRFCAYEVARHKIAFLNIGAYHSKDVRNFASLMTLPSSRMSVAWAQDILFPEAERGERIVVCMRSPSHWGLESGRQYGEGLFVPEVTRGGHLLHNDANTALTDVIRSRLAA